MRICDLSTGVGQLTQALADLKDRWSETKALWNDETARQFEKQYLASLPFHMQQVVGAAQRLAEVVEKAEHECGDEETP